MEWIEAASDFGIGFSHNCNCALGLNDIASSLVIMLKSSAPQLYGEEYRENSYSRVEFRLRRLLRQVVEAFRRGAKLLP